MSAAITGSAREQVEALLLERLEVPRANLRRLLSVDQREPEPQTTLASVLPPIRPNGAPIEKRLFEPNSASRGRPVGNAWPGCAPLRSLTPPTESVVTASIRRGSGYTLRPHGVVIEGEWCGDHRSPPHRARENW